MRAGVVPILVASCAESNGPQLREQAALHIPPYISPASPYLGPQLREQEVLTLTLALPLPLPLPLTLPLPLPLTLTMGEQAARALGNVALHEVNEHLILRARGVQALVLLLRPGSAGHHLSPGSAGHHPSPDSAGYHPSPGSAGYHPFNLIDAALGALGRQIESNPSPSLSPSPRSYPYPTPKPNAHQVTW